VAAHLYRDAFIKNCALPEHTRKFVRAPASSSHIQGAYIRPSVAAPTIPELSHPYNLTTLIVPTPEEPISLNLPTPESSHRS
jgi:hypothetical protein